MAGCIGRGSSRWQDVLVLGENVRAEEVVLVEDTQGVSVLEKILIYIKPTSGENVKPQVSN